MAEEIPYQIATQVAALKAERENCVAYGNDTRVAQIDRQLADLGVKAEAAEERKATTPPEDKRKAPQGRKAPDKTEA